MRDVRFRRALSLAIDREELNQAVYIGLAKPSNNTIMERSELFKPEYATKWAQFNPKAAEKLLDEAGLNKRGQDGIRLLPDGRPATIVVEHASEETEDADALQLIGEFWRTVGIKMLVKPQTRNGRRSLWIGTRQDREVRGQSRLHCTLWRAQARSNRS